MRTTMEARQKQLLRFFIQYQKKFGRAPTYEEMAEALKMPSRSNAYRVVTALVSLGIIRRDKNKSRALQIVPKALPF